MALETSPDTHGTAPTEAEADTESDAGELLPWYRSWLNLATVAIAIAVLAGGIGYVIGNNSAIVDPNATDVGFLQDMRYHHEQAVQMSLIYLELPDTNPEVRTIAREIIVGQELEVGRMIKLLRDFGKSEANETDLAMSWMGRRVALDSMPGLATDRDLDALQRAVGRGADEIFVRLMVAHHQGGIEMANAAAGAAGTSEVRAMAVSLAGSQQHEIVELQTLLAAFPTG